ncbi:MAG: hypothetical protein E5V95_24805 [Mesorhizobium sp.]|uniref:hypothetical protein n=1 Tax=Mesorhizobium sp. TaxID=1871066 RepID=UPI0011F76BAC|nr:hypothetical protein [Mesorhizobium sp.]TIV15832.1 MAG: hypothetical protein E5V95_24805 [Mesorhizobium sp.]
MILRNLDAVIRQWDSFFKEIAPHSAALRAALSEFLEIDQDHLIPQQRLPTEYKSRAIASALHHKGIYKEFRLDGLYRTVGYAAFGFEYQTTYDSGVPLRTLMYEIAVREELSGLAERGGVQFVVLYSGRGLAKDLTLKLHGKRIAFFTSAIFVDLNELNRPSLLSSDLSSFVRD